MYHLTVTHQRSGFYRRPLLHPISLGQSPKVKAVFSNRSLNDSSAVGIDYDYYNIAQPTVGLIELNPIIDSSFINLDLASLSSPICEETVFHNPVSPKALIELTVVYL